MDAHAHVRRLWRHRGTALPRPRRGPRQQLDLEDILATAIALADADGLAAVSTRAVAARFGKTPMALYPYVGTKEDLLALMQDHASAMPEWADPRTGLADALLACDFFETLTLSGARMYVLENTVGQPFPAPGYGDIVRIERRADGAIDVTVSDDS